MPRNDLTLYDEKLLSLAANGRSANEISAETGESPEKIVLRIREILNSRDIWNELEREKLLMHSIYDLKEKLENRLEAVMGDPKLLKEYRSLLDLLGQRLDARTNIAQADLDRVSKAQGMKLVHIVELGYFKARAALAEQFPEADLTAIDAVMSAGLEEAAAEFDAAQEK